MLHAASAVEQSTCDSAGWDVSRQKHALHNVLQMLPSQRASSFQDAKLLWPLSSSASLPLPGPLSPWVIKLSVLQIPAEDFFLGYRKVAMEPHEILLRVHIPTTREHEYVSEFKQAHRRDDDIAIVNAGMRLLLKEEQSGVHCPSHGRSAS